MIVTIHLFLCGSCMLQFEDEVWSKVIFSVACVKNSVHRGGWIPACIAGGIPASLAAGLQGGSPGPHPGGRLWNLARAGLQAHTQGGVCIPACTEAEPPLPVDGYCSGRYASYWNASLFISAFFSAGNPDQWL